MEVKLLKGKWYIIEGLMILLAILFLFIGLYLGNLFFSIKFLYIGIILIIASLIILSFIFYIQERKNQYEEMKGFSNELNEKNISINRMELYFYNVGAIVASGILSFSFFYLIFFKNYDISIYLGSIGSFLGGFSFFYFYKYKLRFRHWIELIGVNVCLSLIFCPIFFFTYSGIVAIFAGTTFIIFYGVIPYIVGIFMGTQTKGFLFLLIEKRRKQLSILIGCLINILIIGIYLAIILAPSINPWPD